MQLLEILGYVASGAVFVTFWMKSMIPLRIVGLASNFLFFSYGVYGDLVPIMVLHGCLFPLNAMRLMPRTSSIWRRAGPISSSWAWISARAT